MKVFLHVAAMNHYREVVAELSGAITGSGLYDEASLLVCSIVGDGNVDGLLGEKWSVVRSGELEQYEYPTIELLRRDAMVNQDDFYLYVHTKGVTDSPVAPRASWRRYMSHFTIDRWRESVANLADYDTVGTQIAGGRGWGHYAGNFWWARGDFLASLPPCVKRRHGKCMRIWAEDWLTCSGRPPKTFNWMKVPNQGSNRWLAEHHTAESLYRGK